MGKKPRESCDRVSRDRRDFLAAAGGFAAAALAGPVSARQGLSPIGESARTDPASDAGVGALRRNQAAHVRHTAEQFNRSLLVPAHPTNGDESRFPSRIGNYSKGLPHDALGEVDPEAYTSLLLALEDGRHEEFERIAMGCPDPDERRKLVNPLCGLAFDLEGTDSHQFAMRPAPAFSGAEEAGEMTELYWMALLRDIAFLDYESSGDARAAAEDLSRQSDFRGPKEGRLVTALTLFRDPFPGCLKGPYLSQFLWRGTPFGAEVVDRQMRTVLPGIDHVTDYGEWLAIQNGFLPSTTLAVDPERRYIRNGRDLGLWVHVDVLFQAYFDAMLILLTPPDPSHPMTGGIGAPLNPGNPYLHSSTQAPFGTFGGPHVATIVCEAATRALKAVWFQKWFVHRRLRPEAFGGRIHNHETRAVSYPIHSDVLNSAALSRVRSTNGSYLLPQAFPEGSPLHPSYGAGHATVAGACVTMLKAMFDESYVLPDAVVPAPDGRSLVPYTGPDAESLTVGGELNKLASNIATGRNMAGIHWRSDGNESLQLGEAVAISVLRDQRACYREDFDGFTFTRFDGTRITV